MTFLISKFTLVLYLLFVVSSFRATVIPNGEDYWQVQSELFTIATMTTCPTPHIFPSGDNGMLVVWDEFSCPDGKMSNCSVATSGQIYPPGMYTVMCSCGEAGFSDTCFLNFTIEATMITCPTPHIFPSGDNRMLVVWDEFTCPDGKMSNCSGSTSGQIYPPGMYTVMCSCGEAGFNDTCFFNFTIEDQLPEVMNCPNDIVEIIPIGSPCVIVSWTEPTAVNDAGTVVLTTVPTIMPNTCLVASTYDVVYVFTDLANQQTTCMFQITVTPEQVVDTMPPIVLNCQMEDIVRYVQTGTTVSVTWVEPTSMDNSGTDVIITQNALPGDSFPIGSFRVTYTFMDQAANLADPCQFLITVIEDNELPVVMDCPLNFFVSVSLTERGQIITWGEPTAVDDSGRSVVIEMTGRTSGTFFEIGTNENIVYTFTDEAGNSAICAFTINVAMSTDPLTIENCPMDLTRSAEPGQVSTVISWNVPTATGVMPITVSEPPFQPGDEILFGTGDIVYQFTDGNNQVADCRFTITVLVTPLILDCPTSFVQDAPPGSQGTFVSWTEPTPMGVEPFMTVFPDIRPNTFLPAGDTIITYMFSDALGQEVICQFTVTVNVLESPPIIISDCPLDFTVDALPGQSTVVTTWTIPTATGFDPVMLTSIPPFEPSVTPLTVGMDVTLTYTFTDGLGMTAHCTFTISPTDVTPPSFVTNCPPSPVIQFIGPMDDDTVVTWTVPTAIDDIPGGLTTVMVTPDSDIFTEGNTQVIYTFSDAAGNSIFCDFIVTVTVDNIPPTVTFCPVDISVNADPFLNGQIVSWDNPTAFDNVELSANVNITGGTPNTVYPVGVTTIMYRFSDIFGNTADCILMVTVIGDTTLPVISGCPLAPVISYTAVAVPSTVNWVPPTATDTDGETITTATTHDPNQSVFQPGSTTVVTYTFTDVFGNAAQCSFQVILLEDSTPPTVENCPSDILINLEPGMTQGMAQWITPTGTDDSGFPVTVERNGPPSGSQFPIGDSVITYTLTNSVGLMAVCNFTIFTRDVTPPQILNCPTEAIVSYTMTVPIFVELPVLRVTDDTGVLPTLVSNTVPAQSTFSFGSSPISFLYSDDNGNIATCTYTVTVIVDNIAPMVVCPDPVQVFVPVGVTTTQVNYPQPTVSDDSGLTPTLVTTVGTASGGIFPVGTPSFASFLYEDAAGNQESCTLQIRVTVDNIAPMVVCPDPVQVFVPVGVTTTQVNYPKPTVSDDSGLTPTLVTTVGTASGGPFPVGTPSFVSFLYEDAVGNQGSCTLQIQVTVDNIAPMVVCPDPVQVFVPVGVTTTQVNYPKPTVSDDSGLTPTLVTTVGTASGGPFPVGTPSFVSFLYEDAAGNQESCTLQIQVTEDNTPPVLTSCTSTVTAYVSATNPRTVVNFDEPMATDDSGLPVTMTVTGLTSGSVFQVGMSTTTYTFTDSVGNVDICQTVVTVQEPPPPINTPPRITCPNSSSVRKTLLVNGSTEVTWSNTCTDAEDGQGELKVMCNVSQPGIFQPGQSYIRCNCTDTMGSVDLCDFLVTITEPPPPINTEPRITCPDSSSVGKTLLVNGSTEVTWSNTCTDTEDGQEELKVMCNVSQPGIFQPGQSYIRCNCTDTMGSVDLCDFLVTITGTKSPEIPVDHYSGRPNSSYIAIGIVAVLFLFVAIFSTVTLRIWCGVKEELHNGTRYEVVDKGRWLRGFMQDVGVLLQRYAVGENTNVNTQPIYDLPPSGEATYESNV